MDDLKKHHDDDNRLTLSHPSIVKLDRMAFDFTESAQALQRDEKHLCSGLMEPDTLIRDNNNQLLMCHNGTETNIQTIF